ncbi:hypothetical protein AVEN_111018-1 [Araneus ventricosus]|uniref:Uncharacterized protein n=1 Tax=Araneus ventricosus TaxID=182803 RepID=A0A4Y2WZH4_ARAVE|nr:hypothetical protein AVEN_111018-1 [Araneus ventricosus]
MVYPKRWIGRKRHIAWPPRSPDPFRVTLTYGVTLNYSFMRRLWRTRRSPSADCRRCGRHQKHTWYHRAPSGIVYNVVVDCGMTLAAATSNNSCNT